MPTPVVEREPSHRTARRDRSRCAGSSATSILRWKARPAISKTRLLQRIAKRRLTQDRGRHCSARQAFGRAGRSPARPCRNASACCASMPGRRRHARLYPCWRCCPNLGRSAASRSPRWSAWRRTPSIAAGSVGQRHIYGGRIAVRNTLYMPALAAFRFNPALRHLPPSPRCCGQEAESRDRRGHAQNAHHP